MMNTSLTHSCRILLTEGTVRFSSIWYKEGYQGIYKSMSSKTRVRVAHYALANAENERCLTALCKYDCNVNDNGTTQIRPSLEEALLFKYSVPYCRRHQHRSDLSLAHNSSSLYLIIIIRCQSSKNKNYHLRSMVETLRRFQYDQNW